MEDVDRERWRGGVDAHLENLELSVSALHAKIEKLDAKLQLTDLNVARIATKIGVWAAGGAIFGGGVVSMIFQLLLRK